MASYDLNGGDYGSAPAGNWWDSSQYQIADDPGRIKKQPVPTYPQTYQAPSTPAFDSNAASTQLANEYQTALGRTGRPDEISQYIPAVQQYGWDAVKNQIDTSPEAQAYRQKGAPQYSGTNVFGNDPSTAPFEQLINRLTSSF